jgi:hypothetical protein
MESTNTAVYDEHDVQEALTAPLGFSAVFKSKASRLLIRLWQLFHYPLKGINLLSLISIVGTVVAIVVVITAIKWRPASDILSSDKYSVFGQLDTLKKSQQHFYQIATPLEKLIKWKTMFYGWQYVKNGDPKYKQADCVGAVYTYYRAWGANFRLESIPWLVRRINTIRDKNPEVVRTMITQVRAGDLIILKYSEENQHVGVVMDTPNGRIRYVSMTSTTMTEGEDLISFNHPAVVMIAAMCYELWIGDILTELNKS